MKMRMPAIPLITVDPYFSIWSFGKVNQSDTVHWTGSPNRIRGLVTVDGETYRFLGNAPENFQEESALPLKSVSCDAFSTIAVFANARIELQASFTSPMLADQLYYASRPVSYLKLRCKSLDGNQHAVSVKVICSEELALNAKGESRVLSEPVCFDGNCGMKMGNGAQKILWRSGDDLRIDWGYFYLTAQGQAKTSVEVFDGMYAVAVEKALADEALLTFAYDDIDSLVYFGKPVKAYWKKDGKTIEEAIAEAISEYDALYETCCAFSNRLQERAIATGGERYSELLLLAYRQVMAAHKLAVDENGEVIYISKECFSNGCAATVDVTYPSAPMYLYYNPELLKGMLRPVFRYAASDAWEFDFAPHDVGQYPLVNGQVYGNNQLKYQMPVEECGNIIILMAALCDADGNAEFAKPYMELLEQWKNYLITYGQDPGNQLCTDDFAGHLAHNCNLALKAIMGIVGYAKIQKHLGNAAYGEELMTKAASYAADWCEKARDASGNYRLAFDQPGTFSLKYNAVWDLVWGTELFPKSMFAAELERYKKEMLPFGVPLDSREVYTKSDWEAWVACFAESAEEFAEMIDPLWRAYNTMHTRVPMTDWYYADNSEKVGFQHRTVQGGLFLRLLMK